MDVQSYTVLVGLGTGTRDQVQAYLMQIISMQVQALQMQGGAQGPIVTLKNVYNTLKKLVENAGFRSVDPFFTEPDPNWQPPPPPPDPKMVEAQGRLQIKQAESEQNMALKQQEAVFDAFIERMKAEMQAQIEVFKANLEAQLEAREQNMRAMHGGYDPKPVRMGGDVG